MATRLVCRLIKFPEEREPPRLSSSTDNAIELLRGERELVGFVDGRVRVRRGSDFKPHVRWNARSFVGAHVKLDLRNKGTVCWVWALMELLVL